MNADLNKAFLRLSRRAEANDRSTLVATFVDMGPLFTLLGSIDHQVLYGRRGTGKTHALLYLAETLRAAGDLPIYLDMRTIGSTGGLYADSSVPVAERATRLLMDVLGGMHAALLEAVVDGPSDLNLGVLGPLLDEFGTAMTEVQVVGTITEEAGGSERRQADTRSSADVSLAMDGASLKASRSTGSSTEEQSSARTSTVGTPRHRVHFGALGSVLTRISSSFGKRRVWVFLDEWSVIPLDLQPLLADLVRRSLFPTKGLTVKIGAIEQRSNFKAAGAQGDYVGIELGSDATADVNLDDFMVFDNDAARSTEFFQELLFKHYKSAASELGQTNVVDRASELVRIAFTQRNTFEEFVRAAEGVPRDAINILSLSAQRAGSAPISVEIVRSARNVSMKVRQIRFAFSDSRMCRSWSFPVVGLGQAEGAAAPQAG